MLVSIPQAGQRPFKRQSPKKTIESLLSFNPSGGTKAIQTRRIRGVSLVHLQVSIPQAGQRPFKPREFSGGIRAGCQFQSLRRDKGHSNLSARNLRVKTDCFNPSGGTKAIQTRKLHRLVHRAQPPSFNPSGGTKAIQTTME